jgi:hypothetical protein
MTLKKYGFAHIPVSLLYRWLRRLGPVDLFKFAAALPPNSAHGWIPVPIALKAVKAAPTTEAILNCTLPISLYETLKAELPSPLSQHMGELLRTRLMYFTGAVRPSVLQLGNYKGLRTFCRFSMTNHEAIAIKILSRSLDLEIWQLVALLLDGAVIERSDLKVY